VPPEGCGVSAATASGSPRHWLVTAWQRFRSDHLLKAVGTMVFMAIFFTAYFYLLHHPTRAATEMPLTWVDRQVPFLPLALPVYTSLWVYVSLPASLLDRRRRLYGYAAAAALMCAIGLACFALWPTTVPRSDVDRALQPGFALLEGVDMAGNACPSLHVASAVFSCLWLRWLLRELHAGSWAHAGNVIWCAAIVVSTLAIRQHVALDVLAGALLGTLCALGSRRWVAPASR
jgi:membrane-associated phospholipid phosphatase